MANNKNVLVKSFSNNRQFSYQENGIVLSFTLNIDNTRELKSFLDCLTVAKDDVMSLLEGMKN